MKKLLLVLCLCCVTVFFSHAQISRTMASHLPDETAVVRDSSGQQYAYDAWTLLLKSGKYSIRPNGRKHPYDKYPEFLIYYVYNTSGQRIVTEEMKSHKPAPSEQFKIGDVFSPFKDKDIYGEKFDLSKMPGKVFVINFWFIGCPPCRAEIPDLNKLVEHYKDNKDVVFIAVCLDEKYEIKNFIKITPYNYHLIDNGRYIADKYGVHLYPTHVVVNKEGKVAYSTVSDPSANTYWITKTVDEALQAQVTTAAP